MNTIREIKPTPRQTAILQELANGKSQKETSYYMGKSHEATRAHMKKLRDKWQFNTTEQAVAVAVLRGWVQVYDG